MGTLAGHPYLTRAEWGAKAPKSTPIHMRTVPSALVYVHHTAGSERGAVGMRGIQAYHQNVRGFNDVAYNLVIDGDDGVIYEGRGIGIRGGHVLGDENEQHGICLMGNFENESLTDAARRSLTDLLRHGRDRGWWMLNVRGHRQSPTAQTACPGAHLFAALPSIRLAAATASPAPPPPPAPEPKDSTMKIVDCSGRPAMFVGGPDDIQRIDATQRAALRAIDVDTHLVDIPTSDAIWSLTTDDYNPAAFVNDIVAGVLAGVGDSDNIDQATVEAGVRAVLGGLDET